MKKLLLSLLSTGIAFFSYAQEKDQPFSVQLQVGPSIPLGKFAHKAFPTAHDTSGNALPGIAAHAQLQYQLAKGFGLSLLIGGSINSQDEKYFRKEINDGSEYRKASADAKSWKAYKIMPGFYYSIPLAPGSKFYLKPMLSAGICKTALPAFKYEYAYQNSSGAGAGSSFMSKQSMPPAFCYQVYVGANYAISKKLYLAFDVAYFNANPSLKYSYYSNMPSSGDPILTPTPTFPTDMTSGKKQYSLASLNMLAGAGIRF